MARVRCGWAGYGMMRFVEVRIGSLGRGQIHGALETERRHLVAARCGEARRAEASWRCGLVRPGGSRRGLVWSATARQAEYTALISVSADIRFEFQGELAGRGRVGNGSVEMGMQWRGWLGYGSVWKC
jgi:hypothetical protein